MNLSHPVLLHLRGWMTRLLLAQTTIHLINLQNAGKATEDFLHLGYSLKTDRPATFITLSYRVARTGLV